MFLIGHEDRARSSLDFPPEPLLMNLVVRMRTRPEDDEKPAAPHHLWAAERMLVASVIASGPVRGQLGDP